MNQKPQPAIEPRVPSAESTRPKRPGGRLGIGFGLRPAARLLPVLALLALLAPAAGCGVVEAMALYSLQTSASPSYNHLSHKDRMTAAKKNYMDALVSPDFYRVATAEDVKELLGGRSLKGQYKTARHVGIISEEGPDNLIGAMAMAAFLPIYKLGSSKTDPMSMALNYSKSPEVIRVLADAGCAMNGRLKQYMDSPIYGKDPAMLEMLLRYEPWMRESSDLLTELSAFYSAPAMLEVFLKPLPNPIINTQDRRGRTALMTAVYHDKFEEVEILLKAGADPNLADNNGETALDVAREQLGHKSLSPEARKKFQALAGRLAARRK